MPDRPAPSKPARQAASRSDNGGYFSASAGQRWLPGVWLARDEPYRGDASVDVGDTSLIAPLRPPRQGRDRCHLQLVSSGNGAVSPLPTTVERYTEPAHGGTRQRPGTGEHHDKELSSRCDEGLRCRP